MTAIVRAAKYFLLVYAAGLGALQLYLGISEEPYGLVGLPFLWAWLTGPAVFAAVCVRLSKEADGAAWFLLVQTVIVVWTVWSWYDLTVVHRNSLNGIALGFIIPALQYLLFGVAWLVAFAAGWRRRLDWP
ncbi:MAG TPA: hypothetical protein VGB08_10335 [Allosphingosinicella sp.]